MTNDCIHKMFFALEMEPGTIVAWAPHGDYKNPPNKWVICDGSPIETGPWKGNNTPNLMDAFLIGGDAPKLFMDGDDETLVRANQDAFCFKNYENGCGANQGVSETKRFAFNVVYIMKIPVYGLW